jgi:hypothetical protein
MQQERDLLPSEAMLLSRFKPGQVLCHHAREFRLSDDCGQGLRDRLGAPDQVALCVSHGSVPRIA